MAIRKAVAAGQFYPADADELDENIRYCFEHKLGAGYPKAQDMQGKEADAQKTSAVISPHAGYPFSGMCATHAFKALREAGEFDAIIILGFSHAGLDGSRISTGTAGWETPLGVVRTDKALVDELLRLDFIAENDMSLQQEHSIEVQLPFLQFVYKEDMPDIVPLSIPHTLDHGQAAKSIKEAVQKSKKRVAFIASSDFTHYGRSFGFVPFEDNIKENIEKLDKEAIKHILELDTQKFLSYVDKTGATICGRSSIAMLLELLKGKAGKGELLSYYTSGDITSDFEHSVSYAAISFKTFKDTEKAGKG